ncbi:MAG: ECF-type sigma factor [Planctomycetota bacterium]
MTGPGEPAFDELEDSPLGVAETVLADGRRVTGRELAPIVYEDLRKLAQHLFRREDPGATIQPTALVHEAYLRLSDQKSGGWENRAQFMGVAALAMRRILTSRARERASLKRGGALERVTLSGHDLEGTEPDLELIDLDQALDGLAEIKPRYARIAELRYFAGLSIPEVAEALGVSATIINRDWAKARAWLALKLEDREA